MSDAMTLRFAIAFQTGETACPTFLSGYFIAIRGCRTIRVDLRRRWQILDCLSEQIADLNVLTPPELPVTQEDTINEQCTRVANMTPAPRPATPEEKIQQLLAENAGLRAGHKIRCEVSPKGVLSVYGLGGFPVSLYRDQWETLFAAEDKIKNFLATAPGLKNKGETRV